MELRSGPVGRAGLRGLLGRVAFAFYQIGYASAMVVVFMVVIMALCLILLYLRQRAQWN